VVFWLAIRAVPTLGQVESSLTNRYSVVKSYPIHHANISTNYAYLPHNIDPSMPTPAEYIGMPINPLGHEVQDRYDEYIQGCVDYYNNDVKHQRHPKGKRCISGETERIEMTLKQPKSVYNYTETGFTKIRAPEMVYKLIKEFWDQNRGKETLENWIREFVLDSSLLCWT
jgi:prolyl 4-hydroxylase